MSIKYPDTELQDALAHATDAIAALQAENARLREALEPFARESERWSHHYDSNQVMILREETGLTVADLRRAGAAIAQQPGESA